MFLGSCFWFRLHRRCQPVCRASCVSRTKRGSINVKAQGGL
jgi:hypothetical protein